MTGRPHQDLVRRRLRTQRGQGDVPTGRALTAMGHPSVLRVAYSFVVNTNRNSCQLLDITTRHRCFLGSSSLNFDFEIARSYPRFRPLQRTDGTIREECIEIFG